LKTTRVDESLLFSSSFEEENCSFILFASLKEKDERIHTCEIIVIELKREMNEVSG
jgi:hypothetical protein|tara:strand:+ start:252 stop:419 length:168 start_codon:yes stop_codon:yes gene_type:complete